MLMPQREACSRDFNRCRFDVGDVKSICEKVKRNDSKKRSRTLPLFETSLRFQTLAIIGDKIEFHEIFNSITVVAVARSCESYGS